MPRKFHMSALLLGLALAGPAIAQGQPAPGALVNVDALTAESDFTVFMRKDVSEDLRRSALRRLWVLMQLPVSCDELCHAPEPAASGFAHLARETAEIAAR